MIIGLDASRVIKKEKTGVEWYSYYLIRELIKIDKLNDYLLYVPSKIGTVFNLSDNFNEKILNWPFKKYWSVLRLSFEMLRNKPDLLFVPSHTFPLITAKKNIITWHDLAYEHYPEHYNKKELLSLKTGARRMLNRATKIITISNFTKSELINIYKIPESKIEVIYLGYDPDVYNPKRVKTEVNSFSKPYILYIGRIEMKKNLKNTIKTFNILKSKYKLEHKLILIGSLGHKNEDILKEIDQSDYKNDIKLLGWVELEKKLNILSNADISICPSYYEGFGLPLIESMALETPVVASNIKAHNEIAGNAAVYFSVNNYEEMASTMYDVITNLNIRKKLIENGKNRALDFTWEKCATKTLKLINSL